MVTPHIPDNYLAADTLLHSRGRKMDSRKVKNNTYLRRVSEHRISLKLHNTDVVTWDLDADTVTLNTGGWYTVTTKDRINAALPGGYGVYSDRGRWFLTRTGGRWPTADTPRVPFTDGITINVKTGEITGYSIDRAQEEDDINRASRKLIEKYLKTTTPEEILLAFENSAGDCWACLGILGEDQKVDPDHLRGHLEEHYVMLTLTLNAVIAAGYVNQGVILAMIKRDAERGQVSTLYTRPLRKYLRRALTVGAVAVA